MKRSGTKRLWGSLSLVNLHAVQLKTNFSIYFFLENFKKCTEKKTKTFRKIISRACFDEYFYRYVLKVDETYLQISCETVFFKMFWADVQCGIVWKIFFILSTFDITKPFLSNFFSFIWYDLMGFPRTTKKPIVAQLG